MKSRIGLLVMFLASGALLVLNAMSPEGFFPSGHGSGRLVEVIMGACFSFAGLMLLLSRRNKAESGQNLNS